MDFGDIVDLDIPESVRYTVKEMIAIYKSSSSSHIRNSIRGVLSGLIIIDSIKKRIRKGSSSSNSISNTISKSKSTTPSPFLTSVYSLILAKFFGFNKQTRLAMVDAFEQTCLEAEASGYFNVLYLLLREIFGLIKEWFEEQVDQGFDDIKQVVLPVVIPELQLTNIERIISIKQRRLRELEEMKTSPIILVSPNILMEIEVLEMEIALLNKNRQE